MAAKKKGPLVVGPVTDATMAKLEEVLVAALEEMRARLGEMKPLGLIATTRALMEGRTTALALAPSGDDGGDTDG